jgi:hypothetical protein
MVAIESSFCWRQRPGRPENTRRIGHLQASRSIQVRSIPHAAHDRNKNTPSQHHPKTRRHQRRPRSQFPVVVRAIAFVAARTPGEQRNGDVGLLRSRRCRTNASPRTRSPTWPPRWPSPSHHSGSYSPPPVGSKKTLVRETPIPRIGGPRVRPGCNLSPARKRGGISVVAVSIAEACEHAVAGIRALGPSVHGRWLCGERARDRLLRSRPGFDCRIGRLLTRLRRNRGLERRWPAAGRAPGPTLTSRSLRCSVGDKSQSGSDRFGVRRGRQVGGQFGDRDGDVSVP